MMFLRSLHDCCVLLQHGEVANRVLSVGSTARAKLISSLLEPPSPDASDVWSRTSSRGFVTFTGLCRLATLWCHTYHGMHVVSMNA
jgi:hypothetical protein